MRRSSVLPLVLLGCVAVVGAWSWVGAYERGTWWMESFPIFLALPVLFWTAKTFPLTRMAYVLIAIHACILLVGAHYTYERVPLFNWVRDHWHLKRNDYDRVGHLAQGFVPAIIAREIFIRHRVIRSAGWRVFLTICVCMAVSACYELLEWTSAVIMGSGADAFLGTQGDPFDTDWDMFCALIGACVSLLVMSRWHDREIARVEN